MTMAASCRGSSSAETSRPLNLYGDLRLVVQSCHSAFRAPRGNVQPFTRVLTRLVLPFALLPSLPAFCQQKIDLNQGIHYDDSGLIVHIASDGSFDGGDTAQREGWYWLGVWVRQHTPGLPPWTPKRKLNFDQVLKLLEKGDGVFYRHPTEPKYNKPYDKEYGFSRDQMEPLVAAMGVWNKQAALRRLWDALPEDVQGKHAFNGNWRNALGQDGMNCSEILKRGCDATRDCSLKVDTRDCSLQVDTRDCSLQTDNRDCSLQQDTRSCGHDISVFGGNIHVNDPICEAAKAAQNAGYAAAKASCEASKSGQNAAYIAAKNACEAAKGTQNGLYATAKLTCETAKGHQNVLYAGEKAACESAKTGAKYACEIQKQADYQTCRAGNIFNGDLIGPQTINLFQRAFNQNPLLGAGLPTSITGVLATGGAAGEAELLANAHLRVGASHSDKDNVGDDLNLIVKLLMAKLRFATPVSDEAARVYYTERAHSYGSYFGSYKAQYGDDATDFDAKVKAGVNGGSWNPDAGVSPAFGAVRWYQRQTTGANPQLAEMYSVIIEHFLK